MTRILAIIVTYNSSRWVERCLGSVLGSSVPLDVFVVDNASTDGCVDLVSSVCPEAVIVRSKENLGFGAANNIGLKYALEKGYDYVYLLNSDAWLEEDTVAVMLDADPEKNFGILSPVQMDAEGRLDRNFERKCGKYLSSPDSICEMPFVMAAHWLIPVETLRIVGGFSPAFHQYGEDDNYIDRLHWHGLRVGVVPAAHAVHDRAGRKESRERRMFMKCVAVRARVSDPARNFYAMCFLAPLELIGMSVKNLSLIPLKNIPALVREYGELGRFRRESCREGAFLGQ